MSKVKIFYREFYDVPRIFIAQYKGMQYLFDCRFDEIIDDYSEKYKIFVLPNIPNDYLATADWTQLSDKATKYLGEIGVKEILFDQTKRKEIDSKIFDKILKL